MKNLIDNNDVVKAASVVALAYVATQAVVGTVRVGQATRSFVKEFRKETPQEQEQS